ncbi:hypothetical protein [Cyanobium sp. WAJ14-Wanaka]|uniref:hypothetical protein n=1 Tax=Cyanobium sp. WAJ14-Wanaka TaxID=2823725 RepID=UPI0020CCC970|nr:hypothetical protein [Cyanobium sp. WAJ14-Wanaka]MCP9774420.1 hypothetical protein [Cyanobium sp. WAJ14-Wanaka]
MIDPLLLEQFARPMLLSLQQAVAAGRSPLLALNGPVGAGKSSFCAELIQLASGMGLELAVASIDDLYLPWQQRLEAMAGNPFGVNRVPPGSHDVGLLLERLSVWRRGGPLQLPRFDKTLRVGAGDRLPFSQEPLPGRPGCQRPQALILEGWLMGCRPLGPGGLADLGALVGLAPAPGLEPIGEQEAAWIPHWDRQLGAYGPLFDSCDGLWLLRPESWSSVRRWRFQAEARQRRRGGAWLAPAELDALVRSSLASLPPILYQDPLVAIAKASAQLDGRRRCTAIS